VRLGLGLGWGWVWGLGLGLGLGPGPGRASGIESRPGLGQGLSVVMLTAMPCSSTRWPVGGMSLYSPCTSAW